MKKLAIVMFLLLFLPSTLASIMLSTPSKNYNLGDKIPLSVRITPDKTAESLLGVTSHCPNKKLVYYVSPVNLQKDKETTLTIPPLTALSEGSCYIEVNVNQFTGNNVESKKTENFHVTGALSLSWAVSSINASPNDKLDITGRVNDTNGPTATAVATISFQGDHFKTTVKNGRFEFKLDLGETPKSGEHPMIVSVTDPKGNTATSRQEIMVTALLSGISFELNEDTFKPNERLRITVNVVDQGNQPFATDINLTLTKKRFLLAGAQAFSLAIPANNPFEYIFPYDTLAGDYELTATFEDFSEEETITIEEKREISSSISGNIVTVKNLGNTEYDDKASIYLERDGESILLEKRLNIPVGEEVKIDLSKDLPEGNYEVKVIEKVTAVNKETTTETTTETTNTDESLITGNVVSGDTIDTEKLLAEGSVAIAEDQRSGTKKFIQATGKAISGVVDFASNPGVAGIWLIFIIFAGLMYFKRGIIIEKAKSKFSEHDHQTHFDENGITKEALKMDKKK